jgi:hypothetical protein
VLGVGNQQAIGTHSESGVVLLLHAEAMISAGESLVFSLVCCISK